MRRLGKDFEKKAVLSLDEARLLGRIEDLYLDEALDKVVGLYMGSQGLLKRKSLFIPRDAVAVLGVDAILVADGDVMTDDQVVPAAKEWVRREKLVGRDVDTPGGTKLGVIGDVVIEDDGSISAFALSKVYVDGPLAESRLVDRSAMLNPGQEDGRMTVDLSLLEKSLTGVTLPDTPAADDVIKTPAAETSMAAPLQVEVQEESSTTE